jgi:hypothetical protein
MTDVDVRLTNKLTETDDRAVEDPFVDFLGPAKSRRETLLREVLQSRGISRLKVEIQVQLILMKDADDAGQKYDAAAHYYKLCELLDRYARRRRTKQTKNRGHWGSGRLEITNHGRS